MKLFSKLNKFNDEGLLLLRVVLGIIFLVHGTMKWSMWGMSPSEQLPEAMLTILKILSVAEPLGGIALILGFLTPIAIIGLSIIMLGAMNAKITMLHLHFMEQQTAGWEFDFLILGSLICLLFSGAGKFSVDRLITKN